MMWFWNDDVTHTWNPKQHHSNSIIAYSLAYCAEGINLTIEKEIQLVIAGFKLETNAIEAH